MAIVTNQLALQALNDNILHEIEFLNYQAGRMGTDAESINNKIQLLETINSNLAAIEEGLKGLNLY